MVPFLEQRFLFFLFTVLVIVSFFPSAVFTTNDCRAAQQQCQKTRRDPYGEIQQKIRAEYLKTHASWDTGFGLDPKWREAGDNWTNANSECDREFRQCQAAATKPSVFREKPPAGTSAPLPQCRTNANCKATCQGKQMVVSRVCQSGKCIVKDVTDCRDRANSSCIALKAGARCNADIEKTLQDLSQRFKALNALAVKITEQRRRLTQHFLNNLAKINVKFWKESLESVNIPQSLRELLLEEATETIVDRLDAPQKLDDDEILRLQGETRKLLDTRLRAIERERAAVLSQSRALRSEHNRLIKK